jgi:hypothetical protein
LGSFGFAEEGHDKRRKRYREVDKSKWYVEEEALVLSSDVHADSDQSYGSNDDYAFDENSLTLVDLGRAGNVRTRDVAQRKLVSKEMDLV